MKYRVTARGNSTSKDGKIKFFTIGMAYNHKDSEDVIVVRLDQIPVGFDGWLNLFPIKDKEEINTIEQFEEEEKAEETPF